MARNRRLSGIRAISNMTVGARSGPDSGRHTVDCLNEYARYGDAMSQIQIGSLPAETTGVSCALRTLRIVAGMC